jgi:hypothetical protein
MPKKIQTREVDERALVVDPSTATVMLDECKSKFTNRLVSLSHI